VKYGTAFLNKDKVEKTEPQDSRGERIRFFQHQGKQILLVDVSDCLAPEVEKIVRRVPDYVNEQPPKSVLMLTDFAGASFDKDSLLAMKEIAVFAKPFVRKSALAGVQTLPPDFYDQMKSFSRRELPVFKSREDALKWLVEY
jgi:hypothetical protein